MMRLQATWKRQARAFRRSVSGKREPPTQDILVVDDQDIVFFQGTFRMTDQVLTAS